MKLDAFEELYQDDQEAPLIAMRFFGEKEHEVPHHREQFIVQFEIHKSLSYLAFLQGDAYVAWIDDLVHGKPSEGIPSYEERINSGKIAIDALAAYKKKKKAGLTEEAEAELKVFEEHFNDFGYGYYYGHNPHELIPNVKMSFYSFHIMVMLGTWFVLLFILLFIYVRKGTIQQKRWLLWATLFTIPLAYLASQAGWVVSEVGRQPWTIQNLMPNIAAVSQIKVQSVQTTFFLFLVIFTGLLIAEIKIMLSAIKKGSDH